MFNLLFLCTGNSARSILAEAISNKVGCGRLSAFSAGSAPVGKVHPIALDFLQTMGYSGDELRSKSWAEFSGPESPKMDLVITVCDNAAREPCPIWRGQPLQAHWTTPDPSGCLGPREEQLMAFRAVYKALKTKIMALTKLPFEELPSTQLLQHLREISVNSSSLA